MKSVFVFSLMIFSIVGFSSEETKKAPEPGKSEQPAGEAEEVATGRFGVGLAVTDFNKEDGFKLSEKATKNLGVVFQRLEEASTWALPSSAVVRLKQSTGVYRRVDGWITFVLVKVISKNGSTSIIRSEDLQGADEVAVIGAQFLRMTDADLNSGTVDSCAH